MCNISSTRAEPSSNNKMFTAWTECRQVEGGWEELPETWKVRAVIGWRSRAARKGLYGENDRYITQKLRQWLWPWAMGFDSA